MPQTRRYLLTAGALSAAAFVAAPALLSRRFPQRHVDLTVPFHPEGKADQVFRRFAPHLAEALNQPVSVTNRPGKGGWDAWSAMAHWDPEADDHRLGTVHVPQVFTYLDPDRLQSKSIADLGLLAWHSIEPGLWAVRADERRFRDLDGLLRFVDQAPWVLGFGTNAVGSPEHAGIALAQRELSGFRVRTAPASGVRQRLQELISGRIDVATGGFSELMPHAKAGHIRIIGVLHEARLRRLPNTPTLEETTGAPVHAFGGRLLATAPGLDPEKRNTYLQAVLKAIQSPEYQRSAATPLAPLVGKEMIARLQTAEATIRDAYAWDTDAISSRRS